MAEAHAAVAFSFQVTHEGGLALDVNHEALWAVWESGLRSWKKRIGSMKNNFINGVYPATPASYMLCLSIMMAVYYAGIDLSQGWVHTIATSVPGIASCQEFTSTVLALLLFTLVVWLVLILSLKYTLKALLCYTGWMYEPRGTMSLVTRFWLCLTKVLGGRRPLLYGYQGSLPKLPVPGLKDTMERYLRSVRPIMNDERYRNMEKLVKEFENGIGNKLQRYLILKSWWATNYVTDWWEEYVYLRGRSPIMVNSNFYGVDAIFTHPTTIQAARAGNIIHAMLQYRRSIYREDLKPILINNTVPLCSWQYERQFNTTRIPGIDADTLKHWRDSMHVAVIHKGRWYKVYIHYKGKLLSGSQIEIMMQQILDDNESQPAVGEERLAALTAADRIPWAKARQTYFSKGLNKASLDAIEKSAFVVALEDQAYDYDPNDSSKLDKFASEMLHGNCCNRWFDKSFTLVVATNGRMGFNGEHAWADAPIMAHLWELSMYHEWKNGYKDDGHCRGEIGFQPPNPVRLQWEIPEECVKVIENSYSIAKSLSDSVDLHLLVHDAYGKGFVKKAKTSPDAYIQMALQLAYYRDAGKFCLTYEASMTRLYREGRTETVRSCTIESAAFVRAMDDPSKTTADKIALLKAASERHQKGYRDAMTGRGIDRHLFCLYVVSKYLGIESPFLKEVLSEPWRLSTSQTPHQQTTKAGTADHPEIICAGGGFGPVADDGYGVSYVIAGEDMMFFHVSSKKTSPETDSMRFSRIIEQALADMKDLFTV